MTMSKLLWCNGQRNDIRTRILNAAWDVFDAAGIEAVSMRALGARTGLSALALSTYFPTMRDLLRVMWRDAFDELHHRMEGISISEPDPVAAIRELAHAYVEFAAENPARFKMLFIVDKKEAAEELKSSGMRAAAYRIFRQRVVEAFDLGRLDTGNADLAAQTLWAGIAGKALLAAFFTAYEAGWSGEAAGDCRLEASRRGSTTLARRTRVGYQACGGGYGVSDGYGPALRDLTGGERGPRQLRA
ncbi:TetR/AcrR family transcriptional regulator [Azospirillum lipoferum]